MGNSTDDAVETALRHVGDPGTAEIVAPGESTTEMLTAAAGALHGSDPGRATSTGTDDDDEPSTS